MSVMPVRKLISIVFLLAMALVVAAPVVAAKESRTERRIDLVATDVGRSVDASGHARYRVRGARQDLTVEVESRAKAGTRYTVYVTSGGATVKAGTIKITAAGEGELELKSYDGRRLPSGVAPVSSITTVTVTDAKGGVIVTGAF